MARIRTRYWRGELPKQRLSIRGLGGQDEYHIGANSILVQWQEEVLRRLGGQLIPFRLGTRILIDYGIFLANRRTTGFDAFAPTLSRHLLYADEQYDPDRAARVDNHGHIPLERVSALFLTHAHLDHSYGLVVAIRQKLQLPPIYADTHVQADVKLQLRELGLTETEIARLAFKPITAWQTIRLRDTGRGWLKVTPIPVSHSYAQSYGFFVEAPDGATYFQSGDFKTDASIPMGEPWNLDKLRHFLGTRRIGLMGMDSTNVFRATSFQEWQVKETLAAIFQPTGKQGRIVIPRWAQQDEEIRQSFKEVLQGNAALVKAGGLPLHQRRIVFVAMSRNHQRLGTVADFALDTGRAIKVTGQAIQDSLKALEASGIAGFHLRQRLGRITMEGEEGRRYTANRLSFGAAGFDRFPPHQQLILATGTQGEAMANLYRAAFYADFPKLQLDPARDVVVLSATLIPGNEEDLFRVLNRLVRQLNVPVLAAMHAYRFKPNRYLFGKKVEVDGQQVQLDSLRRAGLMIVPSLHSTGHAAANELFDIYDRLHPVAVLPIHGNTEQRAQHVEIALRAKVRAIKGYLDGREILIYGPDPLRRGYIRAPEIIADFTNHNKVGVIFERGIGRTSVLLSDYVLSTSGLLASSPLRRRFQGALRLVRPAGLDSD